jgi:hypothetical protein
MSSHLQYWVQQLLITIIQNRLASFLLENA